MRQKIATRYWFAIPLICLLAYYGGGWEYGSDRSFICDERQNSGQFVMAMATTSLGDPSLDFFVRDNWPVNSLKFYGSLTDENGSEVSYVFWSKDKSLAIVEQSHVEPLVGSGIEGGYDFNAHKSFGADDVHLVATRVVLVWRPSVTV